METERGLVKSVFILMFKYTYGELYITSEHEIK